MRPQISAVGKQQSSPSGSCPISMIPNIWVPGLAGGGRSFPRACRWLASPICQNSPPECSLPIPHAIPPSLPPSLSNSPVFLSWPSPPRQGAVHASEGCVTFSLPLPSLGGNRWDLAWVPASPQASLGSRSGPASLPPSEALHNQPEALCTFPWLRDWGRLAVVASPWHRRGLWLCWVWRRHRGALGSGCWRDCFGGRPSS